MNDIKKCGKNLSRKTHKEVILNGFNPYDLSNANHPANTIQKSACTSPYDLSHANHPANVIQRKKK